jgi:hypothetical protein
MSYRRQRFKVGRFGVGSAYGTGQIALIEPDDNVVGGLIPSGVIIGL